MRYALLKYIFMLFIKNNGIGSIIRPIMFEYSTDNFILNLEDDL